MCRMIGSTNFNYSSQREIYENFAGLARTGKLLPGDPPGHADGWGMVYYKDGLPRLYKSGASILDEQDRYFDLLKQADGTKVLIVHLRKSAWKDTTSTRHAHPFVSGKHAFVHNGTVRDYKKLLEHITDPGLRLDDALDTEVLFHYILSLSKNDLPAAIETAAASIRANNEFSALNFLMSDGERLYALREFSRAPEYYTLFAAKAGSSTFVSSEPVHDALSWELMEKGQLIVA